MTRWEQVFLFSFLCCSQENRWLNNIPAFSLATLKRFFCMQDCHSQIAQVECQGKTKYYRTLDCKVVQTLKRQYQYFGLIIGVEIFSPSTRFTQCSSSSSSTSEKSEWRTWKLGQIFKIKLWVPLGGWSVTQQKIILSSMLPKKSLKQIFSLSCQCRISAGCSKKIFESKI